MLTDEQCDEFRRMNEAKEKITRSFALAQDGNKTIVSIFEKTNGNIGIHLSTARDGDGMEPLITSMILTPDTFSLLFDAMFQAAHNHDVWKIYDAPKEVQS